MTTSEPSQEHPPVDIMWILAHPDDETFGSAGTMAWARERNLRTAYICATRGEAGQIRDPAVGTTGVLGAIREHELRVAMAIVGLDELRLLGFRDSGMENTPDNHDPRALIQQPEDTLIAHLVGHIRDLRPTTVISFGPEGIYGHPDHVLVGRLADRAIELAADPGYLPLLYQPWRVVAHYHNAAPRERMLAMLDDPSQPLGEISETARKNLGTPEAEITHRLDIRPWLGIKRRAIAAHRSQFAGREELESPEEATGDSLPAWETYVRQPLPWDTGMAADDPLTRALAEIGAQSIMRDAVR